MSLLFYESDFRGDVSDWDVGSVTNMEAMFMYSRWLDGDLNDLDVSNVTSMAFMFLGTSDFWRRH